MEKQQRNPYLVGLGIAGGVAGAVAITLTLIALSMADRLTFPVGGAPISPDLAAAALLLAWAALLGLIAIVAIVGALVIAGARWMPRSPVVPDTGPLIDRDVEPPGGFTAGERRLLARVDAP